MSARDDQLTEAITPVLADLDLVLFDLDRTGGKLVVTVDRPGGVDLEAIAAATRAVSRLLDELDPISGRYVLEVSSPGLERPLRTPAHFSWAVGRQITVRTMPAYEGDRRLTGVLLAADDEGITLRPEPAGADDEASLGELRVAYDAIERARTVVDWDAELAGTASSRGRPSTRPSGSTGPSRNDASSAAGGATTAGAGPDQR